MKLKEHSNFNSDQSNGECKLENTRNNEKKGIKSGTKERKNINVVNPKITKTYQKVKKYKIVEEVPAKQTNSNKKTPQKNKPQATYKKEVVDEVFKSLKKTSQKNIPKEENSNGDVLNEEEPIFVEEENSGNNQKRKKYKLVEVTLQDDEENQDGNETILEGLEDEDNLAGIQTTESEEVTEKFKSTQSLKLPITKKEPIRKPNAYDAVGEEESIMEDNFYDNQDEDSESIESNYMYMDEGSYSSRYENPHDSNNLQRCKPLPEDPNRQGPKKLTLYVIEEEVDGQIKKRVVSEEDGVTMCEVADLLEQHYYDGLH